MELKIELPNKMFSAMQMPRFFIIVLLLTVLLPPPALFAQDDPSWVFPEGTIGRFGKGKIDDFTFSPDGRTLASGSAFGTILFWDLTAERAAACE